MSKFNGAITAMITPFDNKGNIDYKEFEKFIEFQISNGIDGLLVNGTTAEAATMSEQEQKNAIKFVVETVNKRVPVLAGTGSNNTAKAIKMSQYAESVGVDGILVVTPYYNKGNESGIHKHFEAIANSVEIEMLLYNVPSRTNVNLSFDQVKELAKIENIVGIKEATDEISKFRWLANEIENFDVFSGNDDIIHQVVEVGGKGVISVLSNVFPEQTSMIATGNHPELQDKYAQFIDTLFIEVNPIPVKEILNHIGMNVGGYRLPLDYMQEENKAKLIEAYEGVTND